MSCNTLQPSLFDDKRHCEAPTINLDAFDTATEHRLDDTSSITHVRGLIVGHDELLRQLSTLQGWEQRRRCMFDREVDEPRPTLACRDHAAVPEFLVDVADALSDHGGVRYDGIWMNW